MVSGTKTASGKELFLLDDIKEKPITICCFLLCLMTDVLTVAGKKSAA